MKANKHFRFPKYRGKNTQWGKDNLFDKWGWGNLTDTMQENDH